MMNEKMQLLEIIGGARARPAPIAATGLSSLLLMNLPVTTCRYFVQFLVKIFPKLKSDTIGTDFDAFQTEFLCQLDHFSASPKLAYNKEQTCDTMTQESFFPGGEGDTSIWGKICPTVILGRIWPQNSGIEIYNDRLPLQNC